MRIEKHLGELASAHRLMHHGGLCEMLHGHNWDVTVWVDAPVDARTGIAVDFLDFGRLWDSMMAKYDHGIWLNATDPLVEVLGRAGAPMKLVTLDGDPTAENIGLDLLAMLRDAFPGAERCGLRISEMAGCIAEMETPCGDGGPP